MNLGECQQTTLCLFHDRGSSAFVPQPIYCRMSDGWMLPKKMDEIVPAPYHNHISPYWPHGCNDMTVWVGGAVVKI